MIKTIGSLLALFFSPMQTECLAKNIYFEARNQPIEGQYAVAEVTMNRVAQHGWPSTVCEVVQQKNQFSWFWDGKSDTPREKLAWAQARKVAFDYLVRPTDYTYGATYYHATYVKPKWKDKFTRTIAIGSHEFYRI